MRPGFKLLHLSSVAVLLPGVLCSGFLLFILILLGGKALAQTSAPTFDRAVYQQGLKALQSQLYQERQWQSEGLSEQDLVLRPLYHSRLFLASEPARAKGIVLFLHGFTAGPWQFLEIMQALPAHGFHAFAPRLPGHGWMDYQGEPSDVRLVGYDDRQRYEQFLDKTYAQMQAFQVPLYVVGLSGGGNLSLRLAEKHPEIQRVVAVAPFVGADYPVGFGYDLVDTLQGLTLNHFHPVMHLVHTERNSLSSLDHLLPHTQGTINHAYAIFRVGHHIQGLNARVQFFTTEGDRLSGKDPVRRLFQRLGGTAHHGWYHYPAEAGMPHAMVSPRQHPGQSVPRLHDMIIRYIQNGERYMHLPRPPLWWCQREIERGYTHRECAY